MTYEQIKTYKTDLKVILENCRFFLVKSTPSNNGNTPSLPYKLEDFERLKLLKLVQMPELEREVQKFMDRNSLELEFSGDPFGEGVSSQ